MSLHEPVPNPPTQRDTSAVVGILVELEGELHREHLLRTQDVGGEVDRRSLADQLRWRLEYVGLLPPRADNAQIALALENLNQRMRYALGEYDDPPETDVGLIDHDIWFWSTKARDAFLGEIHARGLRGQRRSRRGIRAWATVTTTELLATDEFAARVKELEDTARRYGGFYDGSGGPGTPDPDDV